MDLVERISACLFGAKTAEDVASAEFEEARRNLIECERMRDYYENMVNFHRTRITSLTRKAGTRSNAMGIHP